MMLLGRHGIFDETSLKPDANNTRAGQRDRIHGLTHHRRRTRTIRVPCPYNRESQYATHCSTCMAESFRTFEGHKSFPISKFRARYKKLCSFTWCLGEACPGCVARFPKLSISPRRQSSEAYGTGNLPDPRDPPSLRKPAQLQVTQGFPVLPAIKQTMERGSLDTQTCYQCL